MIFNFKISNTFYNNNSPHQMFQETLEMTENYVDKLALHQKFQETLEMTEKYVEKFALHIKKVRVSFFWKKVGTCFFLRRYFGSWVTNSDEVQNFKYYIWFTTSIRWLCLEILQVYLNQVRTEPTMSPYKIMMTGLSLITISLDGEQW